MEDEPALLEVLCEELVSRGHVAVGAPRVRSAIDQLNASDFDVAMLDMNLPDGTGTDVLRHIAAEGLATECIVLTGNAEIQTAIEAMKLGAYDYITKPARLDELEVLVSKAAEKARLRRENSGLKLRLERQERGQSIVTADPTMKGLLASLGRVASSDLPVLIEGETGTGKELVARGVHQQSPRAQQPFVAVNCGAFPESLVESELFGHEKGAFTGAIARRAGVFELADRGVLFLDEVGEMSLAVQVKLLRAIETGEFMRVGGTRPARADIRIVSATNKDLRTEIQTGTFREDLYYRLSGLTLRLPPLRERTGDVALLAAHFLGRFGKGSSLGPGALERLKSYSWPGNIRELQMVIRRAIVLCPTNIIGPEDLPIDGPRDWPAAVLRAGLTLEQMEREYIETVLAEHKGHRGNAAKALGIDPKTLYNKLGAVRAPIKE
jgi:DNA-binding NtrC family response regulator